MIKVIIESRISENLYQIFACVGFWNEQGKDVYEQNRAGKMGGRMSQQRANTSDYQTFALDTLCIEFNDLCHNWEGFIFGRSGSHIWVSKADTKERVILIHF